MACCCLVSGDNDQQRDHCSAVGSSAFQRPERRSSNRSRSRSLIGGRQPDAKTCQQRVLRANSCKIAATALRCSSDAPGGPMRRSTGLRKHNSEPGITTQQLMQRCKAYNNAGPILEQPVDALPVIEAQHLSAQACKASTASMRSARSMTTRLHEQQPVKPGSSSRSQPRSAATCRPHLHGRASPRG